MWARVLVPYGVAAAVAVAAGCSVRSDVSRHIGAICDDDSECDDRCLDPSTEFPDGFCTRTCDEASDCPLGGVCVDLQGGVCLFPCEELADCEFLGEGWECIDTDALPEGTLGVCRGT